MEFDKKKVMEHLWTARWYLTQKPEMTGEIKDEVSKALVLLGDKWEEANSGKPVTGSDDDDRPSLNEGGKKLLWYPGAVRLDFTMKTVGEYRKKYPEGAVVHFTAGRCDTEADMIASMRWGFGEGYCFFGIGPTGVVYQAAPLNRWGHHAGKSSWPSLGSSLSQYLVGIEVASAGRLDSANKSWFGKTYSQDRVRDVKAEANRVAGKYVKYTDEQEESLMGLLTWLAMNNPDVFSFDLVLGHDEVSPGRKNDPGGALSMTMPELRKKLHSQF